ncbi:hypothetical protein DPMN_033320, partial [Dreissena polymorpha]
MCVSPKYTYKKYIELLCCSSCCWVETSMLRMWGTSMKQKVSTSIDIQLAKQHEEREQIKEQSKRFIQKYICCQHISSASELQ